MIFKREEILNNLVNQINSKNNIIGVASGAGISSKHAVRGGADLILALNSGKFRQRGQSSIGGLLPFENANSMVMEFGTKEIIPVAKEVPIIFGLCATDPTIELETYIDNIYQRGFSGINNYPSVGVFDGIFREALEEEGFSFEREVEAIRIANRKNIFTIAFVFNKKQAEKMIDAGADILCAHLGFTKGGIVGAKKVISLEEAAKLSREIFSVCENKKHNIIKMIYGGPVSTPLDVKYMYDNTEAIGYIGGSVFERTPYEDVITNTTRSFKEAGKFESDRLLKSMLEGVGKHYDYVEFVKKYVAENYMNEISFTELAIVAHVSRTYLSSLFKKEVGCTFPEYLSRYRINKAIQIIKNEDMPLNQVSILVGYKDYAHFSKVFKKYTDISPKEYSRLYK